MTLQTTVRLSQPVSEHDHVRGSLTAAVSLVEYGDFECPYCRGAEPIVQGLMDALGDRLSVVFRHFPLTEVHPHAQHAAEASESVAAQGKFWEFHDKLYANQEALDDDSLVGYATQLGLDAERVRRELNTHRHRDLVVNDHASGLQSGVNGTPTFYLDGLRYDGPVALRDMLSAILQRHPEIEAGDATSANPRIPRVKWPERPGAADS
jgi:protein-disulfide isomerase